MRTRFSIFSASAADEARAAGDARVVDEESIRGWRSRTRAATASTAARSETSHGSASPPISCRERLEPVGAPREQDAEAAARCEPTRDLHAEAGRSSGDARRRRMPRRY